MLAKSGDRVTAKRVGWDESLTTDQEFDLEPYAHQGDDLEGTLQIVRGGTEETGTVVVYLVGGQEADPKTIKVLSEQ